MGQTLPKYSQLEGDEYEDLAAEEQCSVQFRANIKESFLSLLCLADFVTDIVAAQSLAHRSDPVLVHFGYAAPALLGLTVVNSCMILALRCCYREFFEGVVRKDRLRWHVWSLLALTNPEILNSFLAYLHSNMSIEEKHEATLVRLSIKKLGVVSQLVEDIPQTAIQVSAICFALKAGEPVPLQQSCALVLTVSMLLFKVVMNWVVLAIGVTVSSFTLQKAADQEALRGSRELSRSPDGECLEAGPDESQTVLNPSMP
ncbi:unnamed protein product [Symbiodinium natans]|uniref:XK-related protein n=1 Tax=Symbiodinium natans TaxID=878477 RepID=A0A812PXY6_9DINO|nr:unnamed protein product [Symbiodinium natans]